MLLKTTLEQAQQVLWSPRMTLVECSQGVLLRSNTDPLNWVARFLIGLDMPFTVIRPVALGDKVRQIATNVLQMMNETAAS